MTITGDQFTVYRNEAYLTKVINNVYHNSWVLDQRFFEIVPPAGCPGGASIDEIIDYAVSTNAATYSIGTPMPTPDSISSVRAYFNKDYYHASSKTYGITRSQQNVNYNGQNVAMEPNAKAMEAAQKNLIDLISTTAYTDLASQVDSTTAYSDASLSRTTYSIASYEASTVGALALADLEDAIEAMEDVTYGVVPRENQVIMMARNQLTNLSRLVTGAQYNELVTTQSDTRADAGRTRLTTHFDGVPILVVPDQLTTEILIVDRTKVKVFVHRALEMVTLNEANLKEDANATYLMMGLNLINTDPKRACKLPGVTA
jgi:hypothetical protein